MENNGFTNGATRWTISDGGITTASSLASFDQCAYLTGSPTAQKSITQSITISGNEGDVFSFGAWVKANSVPTGGTLHGSDPAPTYQLKLRYFNGTTEVDSEVIPANSDIDSWQFISAESIAGAAFTSMSISLEYNYNANTAYLTGAYVYKEQFGQTYTYDTNGNVISAVDLAETESTFEYDNNNMLTKLINPSGSSYDYNYDETTKLLASATSSDGQTYAFTYDNKGNVLTSVISAEGTTQTINSSATYTTSQNFMSSLTDQRGTTTRFAYDGNKGTLASTTDPLGIKTTYTYDSNNNQLLKLSRWNSTIDYSYTNDRLTSIVADTVTPYYFRYDSHGRSSSISVGDYLLASYTYDSNNLLSQQTYGNGDTLNYSYDTLDRLSARWYNDDSYKMEYLYGPDGNLTMVLDHGEGTRTRYVYDLADRLVSFRTYNTTSLNGLTMLNQTDYTYADETNYLTAMKHYSSAFGTQTIGYRYGDADSGEMPDQIYGVTWNGTEVVSNTYDAFGRLTNHAVKPSASATLNNSYTYLNNTDGTTTTLVETVTNALGTYTYTYDANGNITSVSDGTYTTTYEYDDLNQLIWEKNERKRLAYYCLTDYNGNIDFRATYSYIDGVVGSQSTILDWQYKDSTWGDLLTTWRAGATSYTVTSDDLGNLTYIGSSSTNNTTHTWLGRQLESTTITKGSTVTEIDYAYNGNGQRISKTVDGVTTQYYYNGDILAGMMIGSAPLVFMYDENGDYFGFTYGGNSYYYVKSLQGDVIGITDSTGTVIAQYGYDAWGNLNSISGSQYSTIGELNPIRYRSYYYDTETGYYYLNSRYYDPQLCRFISADGYVSTGQGITDYNMFAYCGNNPVTYSDSTGTARTYSVAQTDGGGGIRVPAKKSGVENVVEAAVEIIAQTLDNVANDYPGYSIAKTMHYNRNLLNQTYTEQELADMSIDDVGDANSKFHQNNKTGVGSNKKYVIGDWFSSEVVFFSGGKINNTPEDRGTFNVYSGDNKILQYTVHAVFDVLPYLLWGNAPDDSTTVWDRVNMGRS